MSLRQAAFLGARAGASLHGSSVHACISAGQRRRRKAEASLIHSQHFHATQRREVLPFIAGALAVAAGATAVRYLIRAGKRMREMEEEELRKGGGKRGNDSMKSPGGDESGGRGRWGSGQGTVSGDSKAGPAFGIDMGVSNIRLAFSAEAGKLPEIVENREGSRWTPAAVAFRAGTDPIVGNLARAQRFEDAPSTVLGMQPLLGLPFSHPRARNTAEMAGAVEKKSLEEGEGAMAGVRIGTGAIITAAEATGLMMSNIKGLGEHKVGTGGSMVISCPAYFDDSQRKALIAAGEKAGMSVIDAIDEPVAAAQAARELSVLRGDGAKGLVAVFDVGGRSSQCSIVDFNEGNDRPKLVASDWTLECGGDQWDAAIVDLLDEEFQKANGGMSLKGDPMALTRLYDSANSARVELSRTQQAHVNIPYITADMSGPKHLDVTLSRARMERVVEPLLRKAELPCTEALAMAGIDPSALSAVLVVGGCCRAPALQAFAGRIFGKAGSRGDGAIISSEQAEEMVVMGAALEARRSVYGF